jgi:hypothetical protein
MYAATAFDTATVLWLPRSTGLLYWLDALSLSTQVQHVNSRTNSNDNTGGGWFALGSRTQSHTQAPLAAAAAPTAAAAVVQTGSQLNGASRWQC